MKKKGLLSILIVVIFLILPFQVFAGKPAPVNTTSVKYVSLGDSIAYGLSAEPREVNSFFSLFGDYLTDSLPAYKVANVNTGVSGWKSGDLRSSISTRNSLVAAELKGATIVTVCIGSNNLLGPILDYIAAAYGLNRDDPDFVDKLQTAIIANPTKWNTTLTNMYLSALFSFGDLHIKLDQGVANFNADWPLIISGIKKKAPNAQIIALTVYDPLPSDNQFYGILNPLILSIDKTIKDKAVTSGYKVADVYNIFNASPELPVGIDLAAGLFDPHPNNWGHQIIFEGITPYAGLKTTVILPGT